MENSFNQLIDKYMDNNQHLAEDIEKLNEKLIANRKNRKQEPIVFFSHQIDINSVKTSNNDKLIEELLENSETFSDLFQKILKRKLKSRLNDTKICFCLKYKNLPEIRSLNKSKELETNSNQLFSVKCLQIVSMSETLKTIIGRKYILKKADDEHKKPYKWWVRRLLFETDVRSNYSQNYAELNEDQIFTDKRLVLAKFGSINSRSCLHPILIEVYPKILDERQLQCLYNGSHLESVVLFKTDDSEYVLLSLDQIQRPVPQLINNFDQYLLQFPEDIQWLYNDRKTSNYSFPLSLAFIFGDNHSKSGSFFRLKLGLLLSLLSLNEYPKKNHSSVLVICDDTPMIQRLFEWSSLFNEFRYSLRSASVSMTGRSREQSSRNSSLSWTDPGAVQFGADGLTIIASVSNLNELPEKERTALFHALETNEVIARQSLPSEPSLSELELKSTIWAVIEDDFDERQYKSSKSQTFLWPQVFGMVYRIPNTADKYIYYRRPESKGTLSCEVWLKVIELMASLRPQMSEEADKLLQHYYLCCRSIRGSKLNHISLHTLISLSKSMAKLSLRLTVTKYDALMAILLYEESLTTRLSERVSPLSVTPIFHVLEEEMMDFIGLKCDPMMAEFENNLIQMMGKNLETSKPNSFKEYLTQNEE